MNHIHYNAPDIPAIKTWYTKASGRTQAGGRASPVLPDPR